MNITVDISPIQEFITLAPLEMLRVFMFNFGWIIFAIFFLVAVRAIYLSNIRSKWFSTVKFSLLAIDIPRGNVQSPRAVENMFSYLAGAHGSQNFFEKWFLGQFQLSFSLEIVSSEGYTQFLIRTPSNFLNLVESAVYSQYPDAEVVEVDDYTEGFPKKFPDEEYDVWGSEFVLTNHYMYPIKTYEAFEHRLGPEEMTFKDPIAELMELCSSLRKGEHLWYQTILIPTGFDWVGDLGDQVDRILGKKPQTSFITRMIDTLLKFLGELSEMVITIWQDVEDKDGSDFKKLSMVELTPRQKKKVEALETKASKLGFLVKIRVVYMAKKDAMNKSKVINGFVGYIKQYADLDLNGLKPDLKYTATKAAYFNKEAKVIRRKNNIVNNYINRDDWGGREPFIMNIEELATLWHFPVESTSNAPLVQKTASKRYKPPSNLGSEDITDNTEKLKNELLSSNFSRKLEKEISKEEEDENQEPETNVNPFDAIDQKSNKGVPPSNLPFA